MTQLHPQWLEWPETKKLIAAFAGAKAPLRFVGGAVRDTLLNRNVVDVDAATPLLPEALMALLEKAGIRAIPTGIDHGTVTAAIDKKHFEITTLRRDVDTDGRHATIAYTDDWQEDARRRDFTMNALYLSPEGELFDYFDGTEDAKEGKLRFIGDAAMRIREDYLRVLRFFRFYAWFGKGEPDTAALKACAAAFSELKTLSGERVRQELFKLLAAPHAYSALYHMQHAHVFEGLGIIVVPIGMIEKLEQQPGIEPLVKLAALLGGSADIAALQKKLKLSNGDTRRLQELTSIQITPEPALKEQKKLLRKLGPDLFVPLVQLAKARSGKAEFDSMLTLVDHWMPPVFPLTGDDLIALGMKPGKELGEVLQRLEAWWEERDYTPDKAALIAHAKNLKL